MLHKLGFVLGRFLALVCLLREEVFERQGLIEYNFHCFREAIQEVRTTNISFMVCGHEQAVCVHGLCCTCMLILQVFEIRRKALLTPNTAPASEELA